MGEFDLHTDDIALLVDCGAPAALANAIRHMEEWDTHSMEAANRLLSVWSARVIARPNDREGIAELQRLIHYALKGSSAPSGLSDEYVHRWQATSDLLEARRLNLAHAAPEAQLSRRHVPQILQFLSQARNQEVLQSELVAHLGISAGRVTQIIGPMESHGLIVKQRTGRDNTLRLTEKGQELVAGSQPPVSTPAKPRAGSFLTTQIKAAA